MEPILYIYPLSYSTTKSSADLRSALSFSVDAAVELPYTALVSNLFSNVLGSESSEHEVLSETISTLGALRKPNFVEIAPLLLELHHAKLQDKVQSIYPVDINDTEFMHMQSKFNKPVDSIYHEQISLLDGRSSFDSVHKVNMGMLRMQASKLEFREGIILNNTRAVAKESGRDIILLANPFMGQLLAEKLTVSGLHVEKLYSPLLEETFNTEALATLFRDPDPRQIEFARYTLSVVAFHSQGLRDEVVDRIKGINSVGQAKEYYKELMEPVKQLLRDRQQPIRAAIRRRLIA